MSRGKPKGIARKLITQDAGFFERLSVSLFGKVGLGPEASLLMKLQMTPNALTEILSGENPFSKQQQTGALARIPKDHEAAKKEFQDQALAAVLRGDFNFFEKMGSLLRLSKNRKAMPADELGVRILLIFVVVESAGLKPTPNFVTRLLSKNFPRDSDYDIRQVRTVMKALGLLQRDNKK